MEQYFPQELRQRQHFAEPHNTTGSSTTAFCRTTQYNWFVNDSILRNHTIQLVRQRQHFAEQHNTLGSSTTAFCGTTQYNRFVNDSILRNHTVQLVHQGGYLAEYINKTVSTWFVKHDSTLWNMTLVQLVRQRRHIVVQLIERHFV